MPRAPEFDISSYLEFDFTREFAVVGLAGSMGLSVKPDTTTGLLRSEKAGYAPIPCPVVEGRLWFSLNPLTNIPSFFGAKPDWLALIDVKTSECHLVVLQELWVAIDAATATPHAGLLVKRDSAATAVYLLVDWAKSTGLIKKTVSMKKDGDPFMASRNYAMAATEQFAHLHVHSMYSLLDGASTIEGIAEKAVLNGQKAIALTDHGVMYGTWKFYKACKEWGIKGMLGVEAYVVDNVKQRYQHDGKDRRFEYHTTLIAMNMEGWHNLCDLMSRASRDHYYYVPRIDHQMLFERNAGIICLTGCFKGPAAWHLQNFQPSADGTPLPSWYRRDPDYVIRLLKAYKEKFGDRLYGELMSIDFARYMQIMPELAQIHAHVGINSLVTNDCHYEVGEDAFFQSILTKISNQKVDEIGERMAAGPYFIKSRSEIDPVGVFTDQMFARTCEVAERCNVEFPKGFLFPNYPIEQDSDWEAFQRSKNG